MQNGRGEQAPAASPCELGLIAVATDHAIEEELRRFLPPERATIYATRVALPDRYDLASLRATAAGLSAAAALLVPGSPLDVLAYGCTSATVAIGEAAGFERLRRDRPDLPCTTPITAAMAAFGQLGVARVALLTPYPRAVHEAIAAFLGGVESRSPTRRISASTVMPRFQRLRQRSCATRCDDCTLTMPTRSSCPAPRCAPPS